MFKFKLHFTIATAGYHYHAMVRLGVKPETTKKQKKNCWVLLLSGASIHVVSDSSLAPLSIPLCCLKFVRPLEYEGLVQNYRTIAVDLRFCVLFAGVPTRIDFIFDCFNGPFVVVDA
jgi:hypothetical protein